MKVRSKLGGAMLVVMLVLGASNVHAEKKAAGERRDAVSEIDAEIDKHARQMPEEGIAVSGARALGGNPRTSRPWSERYVEPSGWTKVQ